MNEININVGDVVQYRNFVGVVTHVGQDLSNYKSVTALDKNGNVMMFGAKLARNLGVNISGINEILSKVYEVEKDNEV